MPTLDDLARSTPSSRDRFIDFVRAGSIVAVVFGHCFIGRIWWSGGKVGATNVIGVTPWMWLGTWFFQVNPLFFFAGGFSNIVALDSFRRRGLGTAAFLKGRAQRLLWPTFVFLAAWFAFELLLHVFDAGGTGVLRLVHPPGAMVPFGPTWFIAVYLCVALATPLTARLHRRFGVGVVVALIAGTVAADVVGFVLGVAWVRDLNVAFVFLLAHQLGYFYADGRLRSLSRRALALITAGAFGAMLLLTNLQPLLGQLGYRWFPGIGAYPKSLIGDTIEKISNTGPPTVVMMAAVFWAVGGVLLLRPAIERFVMRARVWKATIALNAVIMTVFLWHMTAYMLAILLLYPLGFGHQVNSTARWWLERPLWELVPALIVVGLVSVFGRFERPAVMTRDARLARPGTDLAAETA